MKILLATHNQAKFIRYKKIIETISDLEIVSLLDLGISEKADEIFETNKENALHKAKIYGELSSEITLAIDEAVMTNFLPDNEQPGVYVRRLGNNKKELSDKEVIFAWKEIFTLYPQEDKKFIWNFAMAYFNPKNSAQGFFQVEKISHVARKFSDKNTDGYPMSAILSPFKNGEAYLEIEEAIREADDKEKFKDFLEVFEKWLKSCV
jgi:inosine/xanthosine triphosphate pyrophosphatase family protein